MTLRLVLASASPRRRELLGRLTAAFDIRPADIDEAAHVGERPTAYVERLAREKAAAVELGDDEVVIAADTIVELDGELFGKPTDASAAVAMLTRLAGRSHHVHTGLAVRRSVGGNDRVDVEVVTTTVTMAPIDGELIEWYVASGEPMDKAGAYALQGLGDVLVEHLDGSVSNVIGLPLANLLRMLRAVPGVPLRVSGGHRAQSPPRPPRRGS